MALAFDPIRTFFRGIILYIFILLYIHGLSGYICFFIPQSLYVVSCAIFVSACCYIFIFGVFLKTCVSNAISSFGDQKVFSCLMSSKGRYTFGNYSKQTLT